MRTRSAPAPAESSRGQCETTTAGEKWTYHADGIVVLDSRQVDTLLTRLGCERQAPGVQYLEVLQWRWLQAQPFHNIDLLAGTFERNAPLTTSAAMERTLQGLGGPCHVHASSFLALLRALGFQAHLCAATIGAPGDHLVSLVNVEGRRLICDVGNGHPYARPFPLDRSLEQQRLGWRFVSEPCSEGLRLRRFWPDGREKLVYTVDLSPRRYDDFAEIIDEHHHRVGFGPFLTGVRAVRMTEHVMLTVRDRLYQRHTVWGTTSRPVEDRAAWVRVLEGPLGLSKLPIELALRNLQALAGESWRSSGAGGQPGRIRESQPVRMLVSVAVTGRPEAFERLGRSVVEELQRTGFGGWPGRSACALLVLENSERPSDRAANLQTVTSLRACGLDVAYIDRSVYARPIAESRRVQTEEIARWCTERGRPDAVWMLDDDTCLARAVRSRQELHTRADIDYFTTWSHIAQAHPEISVAIGSVTGDPPIPPDAMLRTQLFDLLANIERFSTLDPDASYLVPEGQDGYGLPDYYYDHTREGTAHLETPFYWLGDTSVDGSVRAQWLAMLQRIASIGRGCAVTRALAHDIGPGVPESDDYQPRMGTRRGGSTVFFDLDACLLHTYPTVEIAGVFTRRSDMIGATRLNIRGPWLVRELGPSVLHQRDHARGTLELHDMDSVEHLVPDSETVERALVSEFFGVLLARLVMEEKFADTASEAALFATVRDLATRRSERMMTNLAVAGTLCDQVLARLQESERDWWHDESATRAQVGRVARVLAAVNQRILGGTSEQERAAWRARVTVRFLDPAHLARVMNAYRSMGDDERRQRHCIEATFGCEWRAK